MSEPWIGPGALSKATGVSTDTLRHYERMGLLPGTERTSAGYRRYSPAAVERVRLIQRALIVGFSLKQLASVLERRDRGSPPCRKVRGLVGERLNALEVRLTELTALRDEMRTILRDWDARLAKTPPGERARLLDMLAGRPVLEMIPSPRAQALRDRTGAARQKRR
jgi:MerR family transcriptional regulator, Zn(II)-responsive regulator of zntA